MRLLSAALVDPLGQNSAVRVEPRVLVQIAQLADGDARSALNTLEAVAASCGDGRVVDEAVLKTVVQRTHLAYGEEAHHEPHFRASQVDPARGSGFSGSKVPIDFGGVRMALF